MKTTYDQVHKQAKIIVCAIVMFILILKSTLIEFEIIGAIIGTMLDCLAVGLWFFSVNTVAWAIEEIKGYKHKHKVI